MKDILIRSASGAIFILLLVGSTLLSSLAIGAVLAVAAFIGILEAHKLMDGGKWAHSRTASLVSATILFSGFAYSLAANDPRHLLPAVALALIAPFIGEVVNAESPNFMGATVSAGVTLYVGLPMILLVESANADAYFQPYILLGIFLLTWTYDTFAYLTGRFFGRNKLLERVSPKKTIEGLVGGAIMAMFAAWLYAQFTDDLSFYHWLAISVLVVVFGTLGDLSESVLKRNFAVKDSGNIMPGHGGILDRFDALLFISPAVYAYLSFVVR